VTVRIRDSDGTVRLSGDLLATGGATGDVLTQQADGTYAPAVVPVSALAFVGAVIKRQGNQAGYSTGDDIQYNAVLADSDSFYDGTSKFVIPVGFDGVYLVGGGFLISGLTGSPIELQATVNTSGAPFYLKQNPVLIGGATTTAAVAGMMVPLVAGDDITAQFTWGGGGTANIQSGSTLWCQYLGPVPV
jgi:hypothetical protein